MLSVAGYLLSLGLLAFGLWLTAGYVIARKRGVAAVAGLAMVPGVLNSLSVWPIPSAIPDQYIIGGEGALGSVWGMATLVLLSVLCGWCALLIFVDIARVRERFWYAYDHVWNAAGLLAGVFFVVDSQVGQNARDLQDNSRVVQQASSYLFRQVVDYESWCESHGTMELASCDWASHVQQRLLDLSTIHPPVFVDRGPTSEKELYGDLGSPASDSEVIAIRQELQGYNWERCPMRRDSDNSWSFEPKTSRCLQTPAEYCRVKPAPPPGVMMRDRVGDPLVLDECIVSTIVAYRPLQEKLLHKVKEDLRDKYSRWIYYLALAVLAGGRLSGVTVKLVAMDARPVDETRRALHPAKCLAAFATWVFRKACAVCVSAQRFARSAVPRVLSPKRKR